MCERKGHCYFVTLNVQETEAHLYSHYYLSCQELESKGYYCAREKAGSCFCFYYSVGSGCLTLIFGFYPIYDSQFIFQILFLHFIYIIIQSLQYYRQRLIQDNNPINRQMKLNPITWILVMWMVLTGANCQDTQCDQFLQNLLDDLMTQNLSNASIPTIIYSGGGTNNPGQLKECRDVKYVYYMLISQNQTQYTSNFTGACVPEVCSPDQIKEALANFKINVTVYDYPQNQTTDGFAVTGIVIVALWMSVLIVWSCIVFIKEPQVKQLIKKQQKQPADRGSINAEMAEPLIQQVAQVRPSYKLFIFYEGYKQLFKAPRKKNICSPIIFLAVFSYLVSVQFSYRLSIAQNQNTTANRLLNSFLGVLVCNTEIALHTIMFIFGLRFAYSAYKLDSFKQILRYYFDQVLKKWVLLLLMTFLVYSYVMLFTSQPLNKIWKLNNGQDCPNCMWQIWFLFRFMILDCKKCLPWMSLIASEIFFSIIAAPFILIFKTSKRLGYGLFFLIILNSMFDSYAILDSKSVIYEPTKLMNGQKQYVFDYQANTFVRMGAFFLGLAIGLFFIQGLEKTESEKATFQSQFAKKVRRTSSIQLIFQIFGLLLMIGTYSLIIPYLDLDAEDKTPYAYLILVPFFFIVGLSLFILPSFWEGESSVTKLVNKVLGWKKWVHLDRISYTYYMIGPMVIAFASYGMQSSIYYDFTTVGTYAIGDLVLCYLFTLVIASSFESQLNSLSNWLQFKIYGNQSKYSVLVIQQQ